MFGSLFIYIYIFSLLGSKRINQRNLWIDKKKKKDGRSVRSHYLLKNMADQGRSLTLWIDLKKNGWSGEVTLDKYLIYRLVTFHPLFKFPSNNCDCILYMYTFIIILLQLKCWSLFFHFMLYFYITNILYLLIDLM